MSTQYGKIIGLILLERFGPIVEKVGSYLFHYGTSPLLYISRNTALPLSKVKEALCVLIKFRLISFVPNKNENIANYTLIGENVILMLRYPKYINLIKRRFGDECEKIVEEILQRGYWTASEIILKVVQRVRNDEERSATITEIKDKLVSLITAKYICRMPWPSDEDKPVPNLITNDAEMYIAPTLDIKLLSQVLAEKIKSDELTDKEVYWTINFDRFHQDMRDDIIVKAFAKKFDESAGEFLRLLLQQMYIRTEPWADISNPIPIIEIKDIMRKRSATGNFMAFFDQYVNVIEQDMSKLVRKSGEASGGSFQIYMKEAFTQFAWEVVEQIILEKFDTKAARIFRLVKLKKYIEPDQIQHLAMIPAKEAKRLSYQLLEENFLQLQELKKPASTGPNKSFTLFHIQLEKVVRMILELCYKTLYNIMTRKSHERYVNRRIIEKKQKVDTILMGMREQGAAEEQLKDIEEMITPPEKEILNNIERMMKQLNTIELEIDDAMFMLQLYLLYQ